MKTTINRADRLVAGMLFAFTFLSYGLFGSWEWNPNNAVRMFSAISIVRDGDTTITEFADLTIDKAQLGDEYISDKAPGMTLLALPGVYIADRMSDYSFEGQTLSMQNREFEAYLRGVTRMGSWTVNGLAVGLAVVLLYITGRVLFERRTTALLAPLTFAYATMVWGWGASVTGHAGAAGYLISAFCLIHLALCADAPEGGSWWKLLAGGACLALAFSIEHTSAIPALAILGYAVWLRRREPIKDTLRLAAFGVGGAILGALPLIAYNLATFGAVFKVGYQEVVGFEGMQQGILGVTLPNPYIVLILLFSDYRGLFWFAPVLAASAFGIARMISDRSWRVMGVLCLFIGVYYVLLNASYAYWDGGNSTGPRHMTAGFGFLCLPLAVLTAHGSLFARIVVWGLAAISFVLNAIIAATSIFSPASIQHPWPEWIMSRFENGATRTFLNEVIGLNSYLAFWLSFGFVALGLAGFLVWARWLDTRTPTSRQTPAAEGPRVQSLERGRL